MKKKVYFSIIIPTYNREFELKRAVNSVLDQSFKNWELIIIDNFSKDNTKKMILSFKNPKIKFYQIRNKGVIAKSRNFGIKKSKGEYLAFLDSDDFWIKNKLSICYEVTKKFGNQKLTYHDMYLKRKNRNYFFEKTHFFRSLNGKDKNDLINNGPAFPTSSVIVRMKDFKNIKMFRENKKFIGWEDFDAWIRLLKFSNEFYCIKKPLGYLSIGGDSINNTKTQLKNVKSFIKEYIKKRSKIPNWCNYSMMRCYQKNKKFNYSLNYLKKLDIKKLNFISKFKIMIFYFLILLKI